MTLEECLGNLKKVQNNFETEAMVSLVKWGRETINDSKDNYCPRDTGLLSGTGNIETEIDGNTHNVILFYNTPYAPIVHENPNAYHPLGEPGFLLKPFNQRTPKLLSELGKSLGKVFK
jgi:hypothetical protein